jgi:iron complex outermembrane receptor protein
MELLNSRFTFLMRLNKGQVIKTLIVIGLLSFCFLTLNVEAKENNKVNEKYEFNIQVQPLSTSLNKLSDIAKISFLFPYDLVENKKGSSIQGDYTVEQALTLLLNGTNLEGELSHNKAFLIKPLSKNQHDNDKLGNKKLNTQKTLIATIFALIFSSTATAEDAAPVTKKRNVSEKGKIEVIEVTSQKRQQNQQKVGIAVTAFSADMLETLGVEQPIDIAQHTPNLNVKNVLNKSAPIFTIRGIGNAAFTTNSVAPVGVYSDELFLPTNSMMSFSVFDVERVEVLKGPQGTLFGRNTTAGAVSFITKRPSDVNEGNFSLTLGNYGTVEAEAAYGTGLTDDLSTRIAGKWTYQDEGTFENTLTGNKLGATDTFAVRAGFLLELDDAEIYWNIHGGRDRSENEPWIAIGAGALDNPSSPATETPGLNGMQYRNPCLSKDDNSTMDFVNNTNCVDRLGYHDNNHDLRVGEFSKEPKIEADSFGALINATFDFDSFSLTSITGYESLDKMAEEDFDGGPHRIGDGNYSNEVSLFSQEFRLASNEPLFGKMNWMAGAIYYVDSQHITDIYGYRDRVNHDVTVDFDQDTTSIAVYAHTDTQLTDRLSLIAGIRYTDDEITFDGGTEITNRDDDYTGETTFFSETPVTVKNGISTSEEVTGKLGLNYDISDDVMVYGSYSQGYKAGVWNGFWALQPGDHSATDPEYIDAYEVGIKSKMLDSTLQVNASVYLYDYTDMQLFADVVETGAYTIFNAGEAEVSGGEVEINWFPTENLELRGGIGYTDSKISAHFGSLDFDDVQAANTPETTYNIMTRYFWEVNGNTNAYVQADYVHQDDVFFSLANQKAISQSGYGLVGFRAGFDMDIDGQWWSVSAWIKNATDEEFFTEILPSGSAGTISGQVGSPRLYGITVKSEF